MSEFKPQAPYTTIEEEFEARTRKAFVERGASYIVIDSRRQAFQVAMVDFCQARGWLDAGEYIEGDQWGEWRFRLTPEGREHFNRPAQPVVPYTPKAVPCETCDGTGEVHSHNPTCWDCKGTGKKPKLKQEPQAQLGTVTLPPRKIQPLDTI